MTDGSKERACYTNLLILPGFGERGERTTLQGVGAMSLWCENRDRGPQMTNSSRASKTGEDLEAFLQ